MGERVRIAAVTCRELPEPDPDEPMLRAAVEAAGAEYSLVPWDGPDRDWGELDLVVPRSSWNYYVDPEGFLAWATRVDAATVLVNPLAVIRRNLHKRYLVDLGVPASRLRTVSFGEAKPAVQGHNESAWRYNRRSEFASGR